MRKSLPYEGVARGQINDLPVCLEDIMPTLLDAAGVEIPDHLDGQSLLPVLQGEKPGS